MGLGCLEEAISFHLLSDRIKQKHIQNRCLSGHSDPSIMAGSESTGRT